MIEIEIDGIGTIEVDDSFKDLSPEQQNLEIEEIVETYNSKNQIQKKSGGKEYDWISDVTGTLGSVIGGTGGALLGSLGGPIGTGAGAIAGGGAGGAAGGAFGEWIEGMLDDAGREDYDIASTALSEGAFGLIPGIGGVVTKGGTRAGSKLLGKLPLISKLTPAEDIVKGFSRLNKFQKKDVAQRAQKAVFDAMKADPKVVGGTADPKHLNLLSDWVKVLAEGTDDAVKGLFQRNKGNPIFEKLIDTYYTELVQQGVLRGAGVSAAGRGLLEYDRDKDYE